MYKLVNIFMDNSEADDLHLVLVRARPPHSRQTLDIGADCIAKLYPCDQQSMRNPGPDSPLGSPVSKYSVHTSVVPELREQGHRTSALTEEDTWNSGCPDPLL